MNPRMRPGPCRREAQGDQESTGTAVAHACAVPAAIPGRPVPDRPVPDAPFQTAPFQTAPFQTAPFETAPYPAASNRAASFRAGPSRVGTGMFPLTPGFPHAVPRPGPARSPRPGRPARPGFEFDRPSGRHRRTPPSWGSRPEAAPAGRGRSRMLRVVGPAVVLALGVASGVVVNAESSRPPSSAGYPPAVLAGRDFAPYLAGSTRGVVLSEGRVASSGAEIVAVGAESGQLVPRAQFFVSLDDGRSWNLGGVASPDGGTPRRGTRPALSRGDRAPGLPSALTRSGPAPTAGRGRSPPPPACRSGPVTTSRC